MHPQSIDSSALAAQANQALHPSGFGDIVPNLTKKIKTVIHLVADHRKLLYRPNTYPNRFPYVP